MQIVSVTSLGVQQEPGDVAAGSGAEDAVPVEGRIRAAGSFRIEVGPRAYTAARRIGGPDADASLLPNRAVLRGLLELHCRLCAGEAVADGQDPIEVKPSLELKMALALWLQADADHMIRLALGFCWMRVRCVCGAVVGEEWRDGD